MHIAIDSRAITNKVCGVSRYAVCLLQALSNIDTTNKYTVYTDKITDMGLGNNFFIKRTECSRMNAFYDIKFYSILREDKPDVFHSFHSWLPMFIPESTKKIVTIHDIFSVTDPMFFIKRKPFHILLRHYFKYITSKTLKKADAVVTVSNYCRQEITKYFNTTKRVEVIYNSTGISRNQELDAEPRLIKENYIFYLGNFRSYKNVEVLIKGFYKYLQKSNNEKLYLVIAGNDSPDIIKILIDKLNIQDYVRFFYKPSDLEIYNLYKNATMFVFPSKYEGFGIPPLEAMSFGVPVIISDAEALVETSGKAAVIFERNNPDDLAIKIASLLSEPGLKERLIEAGYKNYREYNWDASAKKLLQLYNDI